MRGPAVLVPSVPVERYRATLRFPGTIQPLCGHCQAAKDDQTILGGMDGRSHDEARRSDTAFRQSDRAFLPALWLGLRIRAAEPDYLQRLHADSGDLGVPDLPARLPAER